MTQMEHHKYWMPAKIALFGEGDGEVAFHNSIKLAALLGLDYPDICYWEHISMTEELKHQLTLLAGPHGHAIAKMLEARKELVP